MSTQYSGVNVKYDFRCAVGHEWSTLPSVLLSGSWCKRCYFDSRLLGIEQAHEAAKERGGRCLSDHYVTSLSKLTWLCHRGHEWKAPLSAIKVGKWCKRCASIDQTANGEVHLKAQKRIVMAVSGGASVNITGNGVEVICPGKLLIKASVKKMVGPGTLALKLPTLPKSATAPRDIQIALTLHGASGDQAHALSHAPWQIVRTDHPGATDRIVAHGVSSATGELQLTALQSKRLAVASARWPNHIWLIAPGIERPLWSDTQSSQDKEGSLQALAAMDFAHDTAITPHDADARASTRGAAQDLEVPASSNFKRQVR